jgi:NADH-quinone oxidoreductase subunit J
MTSRPRLATDVNVINGLAAVALFVVMGYVFVTASLPAPSGFPDGSITASIGYAMFGLVDQAAIESEGFLVAFEIIDVLLVAALVGGVMLARRESDGSVVTALTDGGRRLRGNGDSTEADADETSTDGGEH